MTSFGKIVNKLSRQVKRIDHFGIPINLLYDKQESFQSSFGGFVSIFLYSGVLIYLIAQLVNIIEFKTEIVQSSYIRNIFDGIESFNLTGDNIQFAVKIQSALLDEEINRNIDQYGEVELSLIHFRWIGQNYESDSQKVALVPCPADRFWGNTKFLESRAIVGNYLCPEYINYLIQGDFASPESRLFRLAFKPCFNSSVNGNRCKPFEEIKQVFSTLEVQLPTLTKYYDSQEVSKSPMKDNFKNYYFRFNQYSS